MYSLIKVACYYLYLGHKLHHFSRTWSMSRVLEIHGITNKDVVTIFVGDHWGKETLITMPPGSFKHLTVYVVIKTQHACIIDNIAMGALCSGT